MTSDYATIPAELTAAAAIERLRHEAPDRETLQAWLESQGLRVISVARSRTFIRFSGTAEQVEAALHTQINQYLENGELRYAKVGPPLLRCF